MKAKGYFRLDPDEGEARAVQDIMDLYGLPLVAAGTADAIGVSSEIAGERVRSRLWWQGRCWEEGHDIFRLHAQDKAAPQRVVRRNLALLLIRALGQPPGDWGILRGVRPGKIVRRLLDEGHTADDIRCLLTREYLTSPEKSALLVDIAQRQLRVLPPESPQVVSAYVGIPFCPSRCLYCSFPSFVLPGPAGLQAFLAALHRDIQAAGELLRTHGLRLETLYLGGGTPTSLPAEALETVLGWLQQHLGLPESGEWTVEAGRPDSLDAAKIEVLRRFPVSRLSLNPQSMQEKTLQRIGRRHSVQDIIEMFACLRQKGFPTLNMDLIMGLPGETLAEAEDTLRQIRLLKPDNLTVHTLALKRGSPLAERLLSQEDVPLPEAAVVAQMVRAAAETARELGLEPYYLYRQKYMAGQFENVGYARPGSECAYNIRVIEERQTILGIGPNATTKIVEPGGYRLTNCYHAKQVDCYIRDIERYIANRDACYRRIAGRE